MFQTVIYTGLPEIHMEDVGGRFVLTIYGEDNLPIDLSSANSLVIRFESSSHNIVEGDCAFYSDGTDGKMVYVADDGLFDVIGTWKLQCILGFPDGFWHTNIIPFTVAKNLPAPPS
jgi:hypothetical protein